MRELKEIINFFEPINTLKLKERAGWRLREVKQVETIGSHVFGSTLIGWYLARKEHLDATRVIKILLVHEMVKAYIPDITPKDDKYFHQEELVLRHISSFIEKLPKDLKNEFVNLFLDYQKGLTEEAKIAREADKLDTLKQALEYEKITGKEIAGEFFKNYEVYFRSKSGKRIFNELKKLKK